MKERLAAFETVYDVLYNDSYSNIALNKFMNKNSLDTRSRALCTAIVMGTLKNSILLEHVISQVSKSKISPSLMAVLKTGVFQILYMDKIPDSAVCNESVSIAARYSGHRTKAFANAVLRRISREKDEILKQINNMDLTLRYSCSQELERELTKQYGHEKTKEILTYYMMPASTCIRLNTFRENEEKISDILKAQGYMLEKGMNTGLYIEGDINPAFSQAYKEGLITLQDEGAQVFSLLLDPKKNETILDVCAAPGGKTTHIAQLMENTGQIHACDIHSHKIELINKNTERMGFTNVITHNLDMAQEHPVFYDKFDRILIDAPCSGLGTCQKRPEIKLKYKYSESLINLQKILLDKCKKYLKPGGVIVYGTCTILDHENGNIVNDFLKKNKDFELKQEFHVLPDGKQGGFYAAKIKKADL